MTTIQGPAAVAAKSLASLSPADIAAVPEAVTERLRAARTVLTVGFVLTEGEMPANGILVAEQCTAKSIVDNDHPCSA